MKQHRPTKYERETIILMNEAETIASIYTYNTAIKNRLAKFSRENPTVAKLEKTFPCGAVCYLVDKKRMSIRFTSPYSEERKNKAREYAQKHNTVAKLNSRHLERKKC